MNKRLGTSLDEFLAEEGLLEEVEAVAAKRVLAFQLAKLLVVREVTTDPGPAPR